MNKPSPQSPNEIYKRMHVIYNSLSLIAAVIRQHENMTHKHCAPDSKRT
jgi:hypothetical protein